MTIYNASTHQALFENSGSIEKLFARDKFVIDMARAGLITLVITANGGAAPASTNVWLEAGIGATEGTVKIHDGTSFVNATAALLLRHMGGLSSAEINALIQGMSWKPPVRLATTAALAAVTYANGTAGVGATLTATANGALTIDAVAVAANDRVLIKDQAAGLQNGIYVVTNAGAAGAAFVLTRATDTDTDSEVKAATVFVDFGTTNSDTQYTMSATAPAVGTDAITFVKIGPGTQPSIAQGSSI